MPIAPSQWSPTKPSYRENHFGHRCVRGYGRAASLAYAGCGAEVLLLSRSEERLEALYDEIVALGAPNLLYFPWTS